MLEPEDRELIERIANKYWGLSAFDRGLKVWDRLPSLFLRCLGLIMMLGGSIAFLVIVGPDLVKAVMKSLSH